MPIQITARRDGFRRLGIAHSANTVTWPDDHFSDSELQILENDPNLIVVRLQDVPENAGDGDAVSALTMSSRFAYMAYPLAFLSVFSEPACSASSF